MGFSFDNDDDSYSHSFYTYDHLDQLTNQGAKFKEGVVSPERPSSLKDGPWFLGDMEMVEGEDGSRKLIPPQNSRNVPDLLLDT